MAQFRRGNDRAVSNRNLVVHLITLFQTTQDRNGVFFAGLVNLHLLEATLQGGILLDVFAIFIEGSRAYAM